MENKGSHIDQFFEIQLGQLQAEAKQEVVDAIFKHLEHTEHPIDYALDKTLSDFSEAPTSLSVLENPGSNYPIIDLVLHRQLKAYEEAPDKSFSFEPVRKKRRILWLLLITLCISSISYTVWLSKNSTSSEHGVSINSKQQIQSDEKTTNYTDVQIESEILKALSVTKKNKTNPLLNLNPAQWSDFNNENELIEEIENNGMETYLGLKGITPYHIGIQFDKTGRINLKTKPYGLNYKAAPFSITIQTGINSEIGQSNVLLSDNQHKDAQALFSESNGKYRTGKMLGFSFDYQLSKKLSIATGITYISSSNSSSLDYFYTDVPVYDTTGALRGYLKRPGSNSNHTEAELRNESRSLLVPINIQYQFLQFRKLGIWLGAGTQIALQRQIAGQYFDFKEERLVSNSQKFSSGLLPQMQIGFRYPLTNKWQLSTQFQLSRQTLTFNIQEAIFRRVELLPALNFGLIYTPHIRIK